jgi:hypothetical protein
MEHDLLKKAIRFASQRKVMQGAVSGILSIEPLATNQFNGLDASSRPF